MCLMAQTCIVRKSTVVKNTERVPVLLLTEQMCRKENAELNVLLYRRLQMNVGLYLHLCLYLYPYLCFFLDAGGVW